VYHNRYAEARGWIHSSVSYAVPGQEDTRLMRKNLGQGLGVSDDPAAFCIFRDHVSGLEYIRNAREIHERGIYVELDAYRRHVFLGFRQVFDNEWHQYAHLTSYLDGRGVPSVEEALHEVLLQPIHAPFRDLVSAGHFRALVDNRVSESDGQLGEGILIEAERRVLSLLREARQFAGGTGDPESIAQDIRLKLKAILYLPVLGTCPPLPGSRKCRAALKMVRARLNDGLAAWATLLGWLFIHALGRVVSEEGSAERSQSWMHEWLLSKLVVGALQDLGLDEDASWWTIGTIEILINHHGWYELKAAGQNQAYQVLMSWLRDSRVQQFLQVNRYRGVLWFNHEAFEELLSWMLALAVIEISAEPEPIAEQVVRQISTCYKVVETLRQAEEASEYRVTVLVEAVRD
jgi:hypothetical protein